MRGCASVLVLAALFVLGAAWFAGPAVAGGLVQAGLTAGGFEGRNTSVRVVADPPIAVLSGTARRVEIGADDARFGEVAARRVNLTLLDVDLVARRFRAVDGLIEGAVLAGAAGSPEIDRIELTGAAARADAVVTIDAGAVERYVAGQLGEAFGEDAGPAALVRPDVLRFGLRGGTFEGRLVVEPDGRLGLSVPALGGRHVPLLDASPLRLESVAVGQTALVLTGTLDVAALVLR